jgi:hypothetical protein
MPQLKVYRTPIGFHDAYVAAPSQKAALEAWGADADLFARGIAEIVTDPRLMKEPLAKPGVVIRKARGTAAEHIDALPKPKSKGRSAGTRRAASPKAPRPDKANMAAAEKALSDAESRQGGERQVIAKREQKLADDKRKLERAHEKEMRALQRSFDRAKEEYQRAMRAWEG